MSRILMARTRARKSPAHCARFAQIRCMDPGFPQTGAQKCLSLFLALLQWTIDSTHDCTFVTLSPIWCQNWMPELKKSFLGKETLVPQNSKRWLLQPLMQRFIGLGKISSLLNLVTEILFCFVHHIVPWHWFVCKHFVLMYMTYRIA